MAGSEREIILRGQQFGQGDEEQKQTKTDCLQLVPCCLFLEVEVILHPPELHTHPEGLVAGEFDL